MSLASPSSGDPILDHDALCELMNIGSGSALSGLSRMLGGRRLLLTPTTVLAEHGLRHATQPGAVGVSFAFEAAVSGTLVVLFDGPSGFEIAGLLTGQTSRPKVWGDMEASALCETGNIMACAFLHAAGLMLGMALIPKPPVWHRGTPSEIVGELSPSNRFVVTNRFQCGNDELHGQLVFLADTSSAVTMQEAMLHACQGAQP